jgi:hypothetical protein
MKSKILISFCHFARAEPVSGQHFVKTTFSLSLCFLILCGVARAMEVSWAQRELRRKNEGTRGQEVSVAVKRQ